MVIKLSTASSPFIPTTLVALSTVSYISSLFILNCSSAFLTPRIYVMGFLLYASINTLRAASFFSLTNEDQSSVELDGTSKKSFELGLYPPIALKAPDPPASSCIN